MSEPKAKKKPTPRKTLALYGRRGDQVRVAEDKTADEVVVYYRDLDGVPHKRKFTRTPEGRAEAKAWAEAYLPARAAEAKRRAEPAPAARARTTHAALWAAYTAAPAFTELRPKSQVSYTQLWRTWETFRGPDTPVDDTTLHHVDQLRAELKAAGRASNQVRQVIGVARTVMTWGQSRKLVTVNELALFKWKTAKGDEPLEPDEYSPEEYAAILGELPPQDGRRWRGHVAFMLAGHHGQRALALQLLTVDDARLALTTGELVWRKEIMKAGKEHRQPLTDEGRAAFHTALYWRERLGYFGPWLLFAGGGNKKLGAATARRPGRAHRGDTRRVRTPDQDVPVTYQGLWRALMAAEVRAGVEHKERRAWHGGRKMNAGNVADATGDARLGMEWIGDSSPSMMKKYLRRRESRLARAAKHAGTPHPAAKPARAPDDPASGAPAAKRPVPLNRLSKGQRALAKAGVPVGGTPAGRPATPAAAATTPATKASPNRPSAEAVPPTANAPAGAGALTADQTITSTTTHV